MINNEYLQYIHTEVVNNISSFIKKLNSNIELDMDTLYDFMYYLKKNSNILSMEEFLCVYDYINVYYNFDKNTPQNAFEIDMFTWYSEIFD
jgi:hypothetical protein